MGQGGGEKSINSGVLDGRLPTLGFASYLRWEGVVAAITTSPFEKGGRILSEASASVGYDLSSVAPSNKQQPSGGRIL